jgi:hypothetical protein
VFFATLPNLLSAPATTQQVLTTLSAVITPASMSLIFPTLQSPFYTCTQYLKVLDWRYLASRLPLLLGTTSERVANLPTRLNLALEPS